MDRLDYWKNFKLLEELDISGTFIYNGLLALHELETFHTKHDTFEILYNLSVGLERLCKIAVVLIEHDSEMDQDEFEKTLITHNIEGLIKRIKNKHTIKLQSSHLELIQILGEFYKTHRYGRFTLDVAMSQAAEKERFLLYIEKELDIEITQESIFNASQNTIRIKRFVGRKIGGIASAVFEVIQKEARGLNLYTDEMRYESKAFKVFMAKEYDFNKEETLWRELLIFFVNSKDDYRYSAIIKSVEPLDFDPALAYDYLQCLIRSRKSLVVMSEAEHHYSELENPGERLAQVSLIGDPCVYDNLDAGEDEDEEDF
ncbi:hypothetical protein [Pseudomonas corrugata]